MPGKCPVQYTVALFPIQPRINVGPPGIVLGQQVRLFLIGEIFSHGGAQYAVMNLGLQRHLYTVGDHHIGRAVSDDPENGPVVFVHQLVSGGFAQLEIGVLPLVVGALASFVVSVFAMRVMVRVVKDRNLGWFAGYCAIVGTLTLAGHFFA